MADDGIDKRRARSTRMLFVAAALGSSGLNAAFTVSPLVTAALTGSRSWSGIPGAASIAGTGVGALALSRLMARRGRGAGLRAGYVVGIAGGFATLWGAERGSLVLLVIGMVGMGVAHAGTQLARFAAAELHPVSVRARILGWVVWASTIGALLGPLVPPVAQTPARALGFGGDAAGFLVATAFFGAACFIALLLRPDPSTLAVRDEGEDPDEQIAPFRTMLGLAHVRLALIAMVGAQAVMVLVMTITPLHVREGGHGIGVVGYVMSAHFVGMFALAPVAGRLVARLGSRSIMAAGLLILAVAALGAGGSTNAHGPIVALWLFMLGLGWSLTFVAGSALLTSGLSYRARLRLQGNVDAFAWTAAALASASSGLTFARAGFDTLSYTGVAIAAIPVAILLLAGRGERATPAG